ncbi:hypothetical protein LOAG_15770, partial [Loa loa]
MLAVIVNKGSTMKNKRVVEREFKNEQKKLLILDLDQNFSPELNFKENKPKGRKSSKLYPDVEEAWALAIWH